MSDWVHAPENHCLRCGHKMNALGTAEQGVEAKPEPGSLAVCIHCGAVMMLDEHLRLRGMSDAEMDQITADPELMDSLARMVRKVHLLRHSQS